jgi:hypothetical protein
VGGGSKVESRRRTKPELAEEQPEKKQLAMDPSSAKDHPAVTAPVLYFYFWRGKALCYSIIMGKMVLSSVLHY